MNTPLSAEPSREWWTRPSVVLPVVATIIVIVALLSPQAATGRFGDPRLSSHLAGSLGARVLADLSARLGWTVERRDTLPAPLAATGRTIHAVLAPIAPVTATEAHKYLDAVRAGDALLIALDNRSPLTDSLRVTHFTRGGYLPKPALSPGECGRNTEQMPPLWADGRVHLWGVRWMRGAPSDQRVFATLEADEAPHVVPPGPAAVGFSFGRGRIVVVGDPDLLRNDVLRYCRWGADVIAVRILEYLRAGGESPRTTLAFDEFHQGFGTRATITSVAAAFLFAHPVGRALLVAALAALVLMLAVAVRPIAPRDVERIERRDPLEQMDALAHAYEQVHATRTITARLVRGMRRRVERGSVRPHDDATFLNDATMRAPALADDVALVRRGLDHTVPDRDLTEIGAALRRIEHTLTTSRT